MNERNARAVDYVRAVSFRASRDRVFDAIATIPGLRGWWTDLVTGSSTPGAELRFDFDGLNVAMDGGCR